MPSIFISFAPGIALAVALPPDGLTSLSRVPWMTRVGTLIWRSFGVRSPVAMIAPSWRPGPRGSWPRSKLRAGHLADVLLVVQPLRADDAEDQGGALDDLLRVAGGRFSMWR